MSPSPFEAIALRPIVQCCFLVEDLDASVHRWARVMGAGPFFVMRHIPLRDVRFRGAPTDYDHSAALGNWGEMQIELHQQHCSHPSPAREMFRPGETGLLQVSWLSDDVDAETRRMQALGFEVLWSCLAGEDLRTLWFDTRTLLGTLVEVYRGDAELSDAIRRASVGWDGRNPLRPFEAIEELRESLHAPQR